MIKDHRLEYSFSWLLSQWKRHRFLDAVLRELLVLFRSSGTPSFNLKKLFEKTAEQRDPEYVQLQLPVANRPRTDLNLESYERFTASSVTVSE